MFVIKKLNSSKKIWGDRKNLKINGSIGTIFEKCETISIIESLRNEIVHNGSWEFSPKVFVVCENSKIIERFMLFPDIEQGRLATLQNRKHFLAMESKLMINLLKSILIFLSEFSIH